MADKRRAQEHGKRRLTAIPYGRQTIDSADIASAARVLRSEWVTQGPAIRAFEEALCFYTGARYAVAVSSGTAALHAACLAAGVHKGAEVITSPLTFLASANAPLYCGAKPVFADIDPETLNISLAAIKKSVTRRTQALIPVHFAGMPCEMKSLRAFARKKNLIVIEDAAHALGASYKGSKIGSCHYSDMTILSFHPVKSITTGEGGAVLTNSRGLYNKLLLFRSHGIYRKNASYQSPGSWHYEMRALGFNYRMTDIQAALGSSQLRKLDTFVRRRREIVSLYNEAFRGNPYFSILEKGREGSAHHLYPILLKNKRSRGRVFASLRQQGIGVQVHYIPVYWHPFYRSLGYRKGLCPAAEDAYEREISLPLFPAMKVNDVKRVIDTVRKCVSSQI